MKNGDVSTKYDYIISTSDREFSKPFWAVSKSNLQKFWFFHVGTDLVKWIGKKHTMPHVNPSCPGKANSRHDPIQFFVALFDLSALLLVFYLHWFTTSDVCYSIHDHGNLSVPSFELEVDNK